MRLLLSLITTIFAESYTNWNWDESRIYFGYNGGLKEMVVDLFADYGYPTEFTTLFDNASDESMITNIASWTSGTKNSFESELTADVGLFVFYSSIINGMSTDVITSTDLQAAVYDTFLQSQIASSGSDLSIMATIVNSYFDETRTLAITYITPLENGNPSEMYQNPSVLLDILINVKKAITEYNDAVDIKMGTGTALMNYVNVAVPLVYQSAWMYEAYVDRNDIISTMIDEVNNAMTTIVWNPLAKLCDQDIGPFEAMRQMILAVSHILDTLEEFIEFTVEIDDYISLWFFGDREHYPWEWGLFTETYIWQYTDYMKSLRGPIEGNLHLWSIMFDDFISDTTYSLIATPVCGY